MAKNINQVYSTNPITTLLNNYLIYLGANGVDGAIQVSDFLTSSGTLGGFVRGPASATDSAIALFSGTTGKLLKDSVATLPLSPQFGGTGINNSTHTLTLGGNLITSGAFNSTFTMTAATSVTFPISGTLMTNFIAGTNLTGGTITQGGTVSLSASVSNLSFLGVGSLSFAGTAFNSTDTIIMSTEGAKDIQLAPNGAAAVALNNGTNAVPLRFYNSAGTQYVGFHAGTLSGNTTWTWPTSDAAGIMVSDGSGNLSLTGSPSFSSLTLTGAALTQHDFTTNSGSSLTITPANGHSQGITLNSATPVLTLASNPSSGNEQEMIIDIIQDATGGRQPTWSNVTWASGIPPTINLAANSVTYLSFKGTTRGWIGFAAYQSLGVTNGSFPNAGYIGEVITSSIPVGSSVTLSNNTYADVTSISVTSGYWLLTGSIAFYGNGGSVVGTSFAGFFGTATGNSNTGIDASKNLTQDINAPTSTTDIINSLPPYIINITSTTTYYLKAYSLFSVGTLKVYGSITARRIG